MRGVRPAGGERARDRGREAPLTVGYPPTEGMPALEADLLLDDLLDVGDRLFGSLFACVAVLDLLLGHALDVCPLTEVLETDCVLLELWESLRELRGSVLPVAE